MIIKWECSDCEYLHQSEIGWIALKDGQKFCSFCENCGSEVKVEIEVLVKTI